MNQETAHYSVEPSQQHTRMGDALVAYANLKPSDIEQIMALQKSQNLLFGEAAKQLGLVSDEDLKRVLSKQFEYAYIEEGQVTHLDPRLIAAHAPFSVEVEQMRSLRGQLIMKWFAQGNKVLAFCASKSQDASHIAVANMAVVFSQLNKRTLLIDANLRRGVQHKLFGLETKVGLSNILANRLGQYQIARMDALPNLSVLSAGTEVPNPQELLTKNTFAELVAGLEQAYDFILIDTTPLEWGTDLLSVIAVAKSAVIVARKDVTLATDMQTLYNYLSMTQATLLGSVFQDI